MGEAKAHVRAYKAEANPVTLRYPILSGYPQVHLNHRLQDWLHAAFSMKSSFQTVLGSSLQATTFTF